MSQYFECLVPAELMERYADWQECAAFRLRKVDDGSTEAGDREQVEIVGTVELEVTNDLELLTAPEAS